MEGNFQTKVDELQRQLSGAEDEKKTLNQVSFQSTLFLCFKWDQLYWESCGPQHQTPLFSAATNGNPPKAGAHPEIGRHRDDRPAASKRNQQPKAKSMIIFITFIISVVNLFVTTITTIAIISTTTIIIITNNLRVEPVAVGGKLLVTVAVEAAGVTQIFRSLSSSLSPSSLLAFLSLSSAATPQTQNEIIAGGPAVIWP